MKSNHSEPRIALPRERLGRLGCQVFQYDTIGSTNDVAASLAAADNCEGTIVVAAEQTAGRGRRGRRWISPRGSGLYVSVVLTPSRARIDPVRATMLLTIASGVAIAEGIGRAAGLAVDLKWPNDVYARGRKLAGILAEAVGAGGSMQQVVLGYGINISAASFPPDLAARATSLESELQHAIDRDRVLIETLAALAHRYDDLLDGRFDVILDAWRARAPSASGATITWSGPAGLQRGITAGIAEDGALLVDVAGRLQRLVGGEIDWSEAL